MLLDMGIHSLVHTLTQHTRRLMNDLDNTLEILQVLEFQDIRHN